MSLKALVNNPQFTNDGMDNRQEWSQFSADFQELYGNVSDLIKKFKSYPDGSQENDAVLKLHREIHDKQRAVVTDISSLDKYLVYHIVSGNNNIKRKDVPYTDFPAPYELLPLYQKALLDLNMLDGKGVPVSNSINSIPDSIDDPAVVKFPDGAKLHISDTLRESFDLFAHADIFTNTNDMSKVDILNKIGQYKEDLAHIEMHRYPLALEYIREGAIDSLRALARSSIDIHKKTGQNEDNAIKFTIEEMKNKSQLLQQSDSRNIAGVFSVAYENVIRSLNLRLLYKEQFDAFAALLQRSINSNDSNTEDATLLTAIQNAADDAFIIPLNDIILSDPSLVSFEQVIKEMTNTLRRERIKERRSIYFNS
jgi:hypothetical protein